MLVLWSIPRCCSFLAKVHVTFFRSFVSTRSPTENKKEFKQLEVNLDFTYESLDTQESFSLFLFVNLEFEYGIQCKSPLYIF